MKSLNVKKIAAFAAGAALIGTAFAGAAVTVDPTLGNFAFLQNGEPQVKVVVGTNALASDAVWAGNIAAALANMAYTTTTAAAASGSGTTVAQVAVSVATAANTIPAGQYGLTSFFGDDRVDNNADNIFITAGSRPSIPTSLSATKQITRSQWPSLALPNSGAITLEASSTNLAITEEQFINVYSRANYDDTVDGYVAQDMWAAIRYTFTSGLPYCVKTSTGFGSTTCATGDRVFDKANSIYFLGAQWVVSGMTATSGGVTDVQVGKSYATRQRLVLGDTLNLSNGYKIKVTNVGSAETANNVIPCEVSVTKPDGTSSFDKIGGSEATTKTLGGMRVRLDSATNTGATSSCIISVYSDVLTLAHGAAIDTSLYGNWYANLTTGNVSVSPAVTDLTLYNNNIQFSSASSTKAKVDDSVTLITGAPGYTLTFQGIDLTNADRDTLTISQAQLSSTLWTGNTSNVTYVPSGGLLTLNFHSSRSDAWRIVENGITKNVQDVWVVLKNMTIDVMAANFTGAVLYYNGTYYVNYTTSAPITQVGANIIVTLPPMYYSSGSSTDTNVQPTVNLTNGALWNSQAASGYTTGSWNFSGGNTTTVIVSIPEILNESTALTGGNWSFFYVMDSGTSTTGNFRNSMTSTTSDTVNYSVSVLSYRPTTENKAVTPPFCSPRGSCVNSVSSSSAQVMYAQKLGHAKYLLSSAGVNLSTGGSTSVRCTPGVACVVGGQTITLPTGVAASSGVSQAVVTHLNTASNPLVVMDSEASSTQPLIVVGGPFVNSVAATMEKCGSLASAEAGTAYVSVEGNKVCVAGYTADDTAAAARELIGFLASWSPASAPAGNATRRA